MMKKILGFIGLTALVFSFAYGAERKGNFTERVYLDEGNAGKGIHVTANSSTVVQVYTHNSVDRSVTLLNPNTSYMVWVGTHSGVSATSPAIFLPPQDGFVFRSNGSLFAIVDTGGPDVNLKGWITYDTRDKY